MNILNRSMAAIIAMSACVAILSTSSLFAGDWPQWRGPNRDGKVSGFKVPEKWPANLVKKWTTLVGKGDTSPVMVGDKLYAFGRKQTNEMVLCLDSATGKTLWESEYPADFVITGPSAGHPGPRGTPAVADGRICTLGVSGILSCFDAANGTVLWRKQSTNDYFGKPFRSDTSMSPLAVDGLCVVHIGNYTNSAVIAFDLASGDARWKWDAEGPGNSSPVIMTIGEKKQLVTLTSKDLVGLSLADGKLLWKVPFEAVQGNNTTPVIDGSTVIYTGEGKGLLAVRIDPQGEGFTATPLWRNPKFDARFTTPIVKDGAVFGYTGSFFCASAKTGQTLWADSRKSGQNGALLDAGSQLLAITMNGDFVAFKSSQSEYKELARMKVTNTELWAHPLVADNRIYIRDGETMSLWTIE
jgi:outer membrane protein assembly factor BamB